jgi:hypothetical protein
MKATEKEIRKEIVKAVVNIFTIEDSKGETLKGKYIEVPEMKDDHVIALTPATLNMNLSYEVRVYYQEISQYLPFIQNKFGFALVGNNDGETCVAVVLKES